MVAGNLVFSQNGFVQLGTKENPTTNFISKEQYITDGVDLQILGQVPFFRKFRIMKVFKRWRYTTRNRVFARNRQKLADNFIFARPIFAENFKELTQVSNSVRFLNYIEIKSGLIYGKHQQFTIEERCSKCCKDSKLKMQTILKQIRQSLEKLKQKITADEESFERTLKHIMVDKMLRNKGQGDGLVMFTAERAE